ncbi:MAG: hypothetical protein NC452_14275 [Eubacterium sp.]|nr:hypothetical protein [Eubacterium sp.]
MAEVKQIWCEEDKKFYPETKTENGRTYKLDPKTFVYLEQMELGLTEEEQELMNEPIGQWGEKWRKLMEELHPEQIPSLQGRLLWELIPRQIDREAWELRQTLKTQYAKKYPRPTTFAELRTWENTFGLTADREIMETVVLGHIE